MSLNSTKQNLIMFYLHSFKVYSIKMRILRAIDLKLIVPASVWDLNYGINQYRYKNNIIMGYRYRQLTTKYF
jgi:hypothetical protein